MTITSSGPICDVCGNYILLEPAIPFTLKGVDKQDLCCHESCGDIIRGACAINDIDILPDGPIRRLFTKIKALAFINGKAGWGSQDIPTGS